MSSPRGDFASCGSWVGRERNVCCGHRSLSEGQEHVAQSAMRQPACCRDGHALKNATHGCLLPGVCTTSSGSSRRCPQSVVMLRGVMLALCVCLVSSVTSSTANLEVVTPFRMHLQYAPALFGAIVLPPGRVVADLQYAGDACQTLLGSYAVRGKVALVDRGKCSFVQKVSFACRLPSSPATHELTAV
jgi:hypothetical protein